MQLIPRWISEEEKADLIARSAGVLYVPFLEDSYGYVTLEAFHAHKPVITCCDSGGTLEIIEDGVNGLIVAPEPAVAGGGDRPAARRPGRGERRWASAPTRRSTRRRSAGTVVVTSLLA